MNDRERLEKIKKLRIKYYSTWTKDASLKIALDLMRNHSNWLIEQAERVQELEDNNFSLMESLRFQDEILEQQNKRYREALKNTKYAIHTQISSINHKENTELENQYIRGMTFSMDMINKYFDEALEDESK